jgi:maltooligosyltrehalose trehalohydrolase
MGEEYGETSPFQYFISHLNPDLVEAVRSGRKREFAAFGWQNAVPDPQDEATYQRSQLQHSRKGQEPHATLLRFYRELIALRKRLELGGGGGHWHVWECSSSVLLIFREYQSRRLAVILNFSEKMSSPELPEWNGVWTVKLSSADDQWRGSARTPQEEVKLSKPFRLDLHPHSFVVLESSALEKEPA